MKTKPSTSGLDIDQLERTANRLRTITNVVRIQIIEHLLENGKLSVTEIYKHAKIEQSTCSIHLRILKESGVLTSRREGRKVMYSANTKALKKIIDCANCAYYKE